MCETELPESTHGDDFLLELQHALLVRGHLQGPVTKGEGGDWLDLHARGCAGSRSSP